MAVVIASSTVFLLAIAATVAFGLILPLTPIDAFAVALSIFASIGLASLMVVRLRLAQSTQPSSHS